MPPQEANLRLIPFLQKKFKCDVGYSGHETGSYLIPVLAVILGATSIERHITLDRSMYGSDQSASLELHGLTRMIRDVRGIHSILGDGKKRIWDSELPAQKKLREVLN
jgi:N-acetylneuraminate synthase